MSASSHGIAKDLIDKFQNFIGRCNNIAICAHENPDADAYGSAGGLGLALRGVGKNVVFLNSSKLIDRLAFVPSAVETLSSLPADFKPDALIVCDCGSFSRIGDVLQAQFSNIGDFPVFNIDHHISNDKFGTANIVVVEASSTAEVVVALLTESKIAISPESATALYAGIMADSGSFRYSCVRPYTFDAAALCVAAGAIPYKISEKLFSSNSISQVKLHAHALLEMTLHISSKVALVVTSAEMLKKHNATISDSEGLAEQARDVQGVIVSILMKEDQIFPEDPASKEGPVTLWRVSLRSKSQDVDLSALAQRFGGGGHKAAAAFRSRKSKQEIVAILMTELEIILATVG